MKFLPEKITSDHAAEGHEGEKKHKRRGEKGERGENPNDTRVSSGRKRGEKGRKLGEFAYQSPQYPVESLGPLSDVCKTIAKNGQIDAALAGQSLLSAVSLCTQGLYEVETLSGIKPLSLFCLSIADSGDGKSTGESIALHAIREHDREEHQYYQRQIEAEAEKPRKEQMELITPYRICNDATTQGVIRSFRTGFPSQGVFTAEGAVMLCGWGMSAENKLNTAGNLNRFWDGEPVSIMRGAEGRTQLYNRRFCAHWLIQPDAAQEAMNDPALANIGLWPRFLISWPEPLKPRLYKRFDYHNDVAIAAYWERCNALLSVDVMGESNECNNLKTIRLSDDARDEFIEFFECMEQSRHGKNNLNFIKAFAVRATENACRIAGNMAAFANHKPGIMDFEVSGEDAENAIAIVRYSLDTWRGIFGTREDREHEIWAQHLYNWLLSRQDQRATETAMLKTVTPKSLRNRHKRDVAIAILQERGLIRRFIEVMPDGSSRVSNNEWKTINNDD